MHVVQEVAADHFQGVIVDPVVVPLLAHGQDEVLLRGLARDLLGIGDRVRAMGVSTKTCRPASSAAKRGRGVQVRGQGDDHGLQPVGLGGCQQLVVRIVDANVFFTSACPPLSL